MNTSTSKKVIGVTGKIGAGKSTFLKELALLIPEEAERIGTGDILKERLISHGIPVTRENLNALGRSLREEYGPLVITDIVRERIQTSISRIILIDGVRGQNTAKLIREYKDSLLVAVVADFDTRYERIVSRREKPDEIDCTKEKFGILNEQDMPEELALLEREADIRIVNTTSYEAFKVQIESLAKQILSV